MLPAYNGEVHVCYEGLPGRGALSTWDVGQALLKKHGLGYPERWWWVGWDQYWFRGNAESAVASLGRTSYRCSAEKHIWLRG